MPRKSLLTEDQWAEIGRRLLEGEEAAALAREFGLANESTIRTHFKRKGLQTTSIQKIAAQVFDAEQATKAAQQSLRTLEPAAQMATLTLVARMRSTFDKLAQAAEINAASAIRCASLANDELMKIDDVDVGGKKSKALRETARELLKASNEAAELGKSMFTAAANRDAVRRMAEDDIPVGSAEVTPERLREGARRIAFTLHRAAAMEKS